MEERPGRRSLGEDISWTRWHVYAWLAVVLFPAMVIGELVSGRWAAALAFSLMWIAAVIEVAKWFGYERPGLVVLQTIGLGSGVLLWIWRDWVWWLRGYVWLRDGLRGLLGSS